MHLPHVAGAILGLIAVCHCDGIELACGPISTIVVTVSATATITETVGLASHSSYGANSDIVSATVAANPAFTTVVTTLIQEITETIAVSETLPGSVSTTAAILPTPTVSGLYFFSVDNGTTIWLGGATPPSAQSYVIQTSTFTLQPVPSTSSYLAMEQIYSTSTETIEVTSFLTVLTKTLTEPITSSTTSTSTTTVEVTSIATVYLTETLTESSPSATTAATASRFAGLGAGSYGWNTTILHHSKPTEGWSGTLGYSIYATAASSVRAPRPSRSDLENAPISPRHYGNRKNARQVGAIVTATIDGVVVTWTNVWAGVEPSSTPLPVSVSPSLPTVTISDSLSVSSSLSAAAVSYGPPGYPLTRFSIPSYPVPTVHPSIVEPSSTFIPTTSVLSVISASVESSTLVITTASSSEGPAVTQTPSEFTNPTLFNPTESPWAPSPTTSAAPFSNSTTSSTAVASPTTTGCPVSSLNIGNFTITFDDLPTFGGIPGEADYPPIFNPYHDLFWAQGFAYAPPPEDPYAPISPPQLAVFVTNQSANVHPANITGPPGPGDDIDGQFGAGPRFANPVFWIDTFSAYVGCTNAGPGNCEITVNGFVYEKNFKNTVLYARQTFYQPPCPTLINCELMHIEFGPDFRNLTSLQIIATVGNSTVLNTWYMDDLELAWSDTSCAAAQERYQAAIRHP